MLIIKENNGEFILKKTILYLQYFYKSKSVLKYKTYLKLYDTSLHWKATILQE